MPYFAREKNNNSERETAVAHTQQHRRLTVQFWFCLAVLPCCHIYEHSYIYHKSRIVTAVPHVILRRHENNAPLKSTTIWCKLYHRYTALYLILIRHDTAVATLRACAQLRSIGRLKPRTAAHDHGSIGARRRLRSTCVLSQRYIISRQKKDTTSASGRNCCLVGTAV